MQKKYLKIIKNLKFRKEFCIWPAPQYYVQDKQEFNLVAIFK